MDESDMQVEEEDDRSQQNDQSKQQDREKAKDARFPFRQQTAADENRSIRSPARL